MTVGEYFCGAIIGVAIIILDLIQEYKKSDFRFPVLAVAVGIYLPIGLSVPIFIGGVLNRNTDKIFQKDNLLKASGLITGEALMGILIALPIFLYGNPSWWPSIQNPILWIGVMLFLLTCFWIMNNKRIDNNT